MKQIYLDYQASTPLDPRVVASMEPFYRKVYANPHATTYKQAISSARAVETSRIQVANALNVDPKEIIFTSGATESNNLTILGLASSENKLRRKIITQPTEHQSVLGPVKYLKKQGFHIDIVKVNRNGIVNLHELERMINHQTLLVSIMMVNNETGVIQPIREITEICENYGAVFHSDCAQALGKVPIDIRDNRIGMATLSGHKIYGPKGIGALFVRNNLQKKLKPVYLGGDQEKGFRPGTLPVPLCVGFGRAAEIADLEQLEYQSKAMSYIKSIRKSLDSSVLDVHYHGDLENIAPGCLSVAIPKYRAEDLLEKWSDLEFSTGSACAASKHVSSHVLRAMKVPRHIVESTIRLSVGRYTTANDVQVLVKNIKNLSKQ